MWTLIDDLDAFYPEHRRFGDLDSGVEGERVWMTCDCGAGLSRVVVKQREPRGHPLALARPPC